MKAKHLASIDEICTEDLLEIMELSREIKDHPEWYRSTLSGQTMALIFQKPSTRTRVSFQVGIHELGGLGLSLGQNELQLGRGETVADTAQVLSRFVQGIMARVFSHDDIDVLAKYATVPVINGLSDLLHPCQAICDFFTMEEKFGDCSGLKVVYVGDGNNVAHSLAHAAAKLGAHLVIASPGGDYACDEGEMAKARAVAAEHGATIEEVVDPREAVKGAKVIYSDVWTSMGQEEEAKKRLVDLADYQVNTDLFNLADDDAIFMHCLPAHRGEEVTDAVVDHERSVVFDQAENRLHTQKAVMALLMGL